MKTILINQIISLLSGMEKQDIIIFDTYNCGPGMYRHNGRIINEQEKAELQKGCKRSIVFTLAKDKTNDIESVSDKDRLQIKVNDEVTAGTLLKLRKGVKP
jgi:hypothetical protein